ncbi:MAG: SDR family oxidoreductase [bacterium]|nr:SDR family oxidoreductase [Gammaproteobacteria bacterium]HIL96343.1 SDR family oxidoreductase [Pseudomonadales bacterium]
MESKTVEHFDLTGKKAIVVAADQPAGAAIADAYEEAGATVARVEQLPAVELTDKITEAANSLDGLDILACASDLFLAKPIKDISMGELATTMMTNFISPFAACQAALPFIRKGTSGNSSGNGNGNGNCNGNIVLVTSVLGERGLPNTSVYSAAHGAVFNFIRAMAQELAPEGISINGIELGWMDWMDDRINMKDENAARAVRFTISKRAGTAEDIGPLAVWLSGSGVGFVTGQIFPLDGGLTQHL